MQASGNKDPNDSFKSVNKFTEIKTSRTGQDEKAVHIESQSTIAKIPDNQQATSQQKSLTQTITGRDFSFKASLMTTIGSSLVVIGITGAILLLPLTITGGTLGVCAGLIAKKMGLIKNDEGGSMIAGLVVGSLGLAGIAMAGAKLKIHGEEKQKEYIAKKAIEREQSNLVNMIDPLNGHEDDEISASEKQKEPLKTEEPQAAIVKPDEKPVTAKMKEPEKAKSPEKEASQDPVNKEFINEYKKKIQVGEEKISEEHLDVIANFLYNKMVKKLGTEDISKFPNILITSNVAGHIIVQVGVEESERIGKGANKNVFSGYVFTVNPEFSNIEKIKGKFAILRVHHSKDEAKSENTLAEHFNSPNILEKSMLTFDADNEWIMVNKEIPFFFSDLIVKKDQKKDKNTSFEYLINGMEGVASGLAAIHDKGYVHRDIKQDNMGIKKDGTGVLIDLGLVKLVNSSHNGSPLDFSPPELASGGFSSKESDLYSFGLTLFKTFHPENKNLYEVLAKVKDEDGEDFSFQNHRKLISALKNEQTLNTQEQENATPENPAEIETQVIDCYNNHLFDGWLPKNAAEKELQTLISKLLSYEPEKRGTADEAVKSLQQIKSNNTK